MKTFLLRTTRSDIFLQDYDYNIEVRSFTLNLTKVPMPRYCIHQSFRLAAALRNSCQGGRVSALFHSNRKASKYILLIDLFIR